MRFRPTTSLTFSILLIISILTACAEKEPVDSVNFLIPQEPGGGWDGVARSVGETLIATGLVDQVNYDNMPGERTTKAYRHLVNQANQQDTLFASSVSIVTLSMVLPDYSYKDLSPVASVAGDYFAWFVLPDSPIQSMQDVMSIVDDPDRSLILGGGRGAQSQILFTALLLGDDRTLEGMEYVVMGGHDALADDLAAGKADVVTYGLSIGLPLVKAGKLRVVGYTAPEAVAGLSGMRTLRDQGFDFDYINYRLLMAGPGLSEERFKEFDTMLGAMTKTPQWRSLLLEKRWADTYLSGQELENALQDIETLLAPAVLAIEANAQKK